MNFLIVALGGALGASLRYFVVNIFIKYKNMPTNFNDNLLAPIIYILPSSIAVLALNIIGSFALGMLTNILDFNNYFASISSYKENIRLLIGTGILGALTTFSAFSIEALFLMQKGYMLSSLIYIFANVVFSLLACFVGFKLGSIL